ncbi:MAG: malectin [Patescibacteria group bacterium]
MISLNQMIKIILKIKNKKGFVILFAVTLSSLILAIALGVSNITLKEMKFSTSAKDTNEAFFAADTGIECALMNDKPVSKFSVAGPATALTCAAGIPTYSAGTNTGLYTFLVTGLSNNGTSCAKVSVFKDAAIDPPFIVTTLTSKGYNIGDPSCNSSNPNRIEREIKASYGVGAASVVPVALINSGGGAYTDSLSRSWSADNSFSGGSLYSTTNSIIGTSDQTLYQDLRYGNMTYTVTGLTPSASYTVILKFAEIFWSSPGQRVFNVNINGTSVLTNFDIIQDVGSNFKAVDKSFSATANGSGQIIIQFITVVDNAQINAIEID